jgi:nitrogen fixation/metabolism regulation signal transduction histidine kinase
MKIPTFSSLRARMFAVLVLVSVIPALLTLITGTMAIREVVRSTGSAGAWEEVAASGRTLFDEIQNQGAPSAELITATERHQGALEESLRFSRVYALIGERVLVLLPLLALLLLLLVSGLALGAANWLSRGFSRPVEELVQMTRSLASGGTPALSESGGPSDIREFAQLRAAIHTTSDELREARRRELEQARTRTWSEMARRIAHELKNPLTPMAMAADRVARSGDPSIALAGEILKEEVGRLDELARTFAQFGHPPEGPMSTVDLAEVVSSLAGRLGSDGAEIRFTTPGTPVLVTGHLEPLERVVRNLLSNAYDSVLAKAATDLVGESGPLESGEPIEITVFSEPGWAEIQVRDRGTGIPEELMERIWAPDFTTRRKGTGLGLAMVRQVVHAHGGRVRAANRAKGGAEFTVRLPAAVS